MIRHDQHMVVLGHPPVKGTTQGPRGRGSFGREVGLLHGFPKGVK